jgi:hypothetical protein
VGRRRAERGSESVRTPRTRQRCSQQQGNDPDVQAEVVAAIPQILRANVKKAKQGSLVHTKWLWGVVEKMPKAHGVKTTLAELLMEQMEGGEG